MSNFGIGIGEFMKGVASGANTMSNMQDSWSRKDLRDMQMDDLKQAREDKKALRQTTTQGFSDAQANTDGQIDNVWNYYMQNTAPKVVEHYMSAGDPNTANAYRQWIADSNVQQGAKYGVGMMRAAAMKDLDGVGKNMMLAYNQPGYFEDGNTATGYTVLKNDKGEPAGLEITVKGADGKETKQKFDNVDEIYKLASTFGNPLEVFKTGVAQYQAQQAQAQKTKAELAKEGREWDRTLTTKQIDQNFSIEKDNNASQLRQAEEAAKQRNGGNSNVVRDAKAKEQYLRDKGVPETRIKALAPQLVGVDRQEVPITKRIDDYISNKDKDVLDKEWQKLTGAQKTERAIGDLQARDQASQGYYGEGAGLPQQTQPGQQTQGTQPRMALGYDTRTGKPVMIPVK
ncbi:hypothetical protein [Leclercia sp.]|uniref:hypothetical protein n=1 Tax=Leclercia sp. TaxID=1898428 RepID=UPI0028BD56C0|nr:hypothetical protein [Leclercia sp.]